jgi:aminopeptidase N
MLEQRIGRPAFDRGVAAFFAAHRGSDAGWRELQGAFERASGRDLQAFFAQWLERTGAPAISLHDVRFGASEVRFALQQEPGSYELQVPVAIVTERGTVTRVVSLAGARAEFALPTDGHPTALRIDPEQHVFRRLAAGETAPIVRDVTIRPDAQVIALDADGAARESVVALARALLHGTPEVLAASGWKRDRPAIVFAVGTPAALAAKFGLRAPGLREDGATAWVWADPAAPAPTLIVCGADAAALQALLRPLPHYGREGWLVFRGAQLVDRGNWPAPPVNALAAHE